MSDYDLWEHLGLHGQMTTGWWYVVAVLPATIFAGCAFLLMWLAQRRERRLPTMFLWLALSGLPLLLVLPSFYVRRSLTAALARIDVRLSGDIQQLSEPMARQIGGYLDQIATLGIVGASLALAACFAGLLIGGFAPAPLVQAVQTISQRLTRAVTRTFRARPAARPPASARHGLIRVTRGQQQGAQFAIVDGAVIGKEEAMVTLTDPVVSRRHAHFEVRDNLAHLVDDRSMNGTFLRRNGSVQELSGQSVPLQHGDTIFLGPPEQSAAVELSFEQAAMGGAT